MDALTINLFQFGYGSAVCAHAVHFVWSLLVQIVRYRRDKINMNTYVKGNGFASETDFGGHVYMHFIPIRKRWRHHSVAFDLFFFFAIRGFTSSAFTIRLFSRADLTIMGTQYWHIWTLNSRSKREEKKEASTFYITHLFHWFWHIHHVKINENLRSVKQSTANECWWDVRVQEVTLNGFCFIFVVYMHLRYSIYSLGCSKWHVRAYRSIFKLI